MVAKGGSRRMQATATLLDNHTRLIARLAESRSITDDLFRIVRSDALYDRPIAERHRIVFYLGHLEAFDWNLIAGQALGLGPAHQNSIASLPSVSIRWAAGFRRTNPPIGLAARKSKPITLASERNLTRSCATTPRARQGDGSIRAKPS